MLDIWVGLCLSEYINKRGDTMKVYQTSDGYKFYVQSNGVVTDTPKIDDCDLMFDNVDQLLLCDEDTKYVGDIISYGEILNSRSSYT